MKMKKSILPVLLAVALATAAIFLAVVNVFVVLAAAVGVFETVVKPVQNLTQQKVTDTTEGE